MLLLEQSYGFVPVFRDADADRFLLVRQADGHWSFPKGHAEDAETPIETARRELREETGIGEIKLLPEYIFSERYTFQRNDLPTEKSNIFFLGLLDSAQTSPQEGEILECRFVAEGETRVLDLFDDTKRILGEAAIVLARIPK